MTINNEYKIKDIVYHTVTKFTEDNLRGVIVQIIVGGPDTVEYKVSWENAQEGVHYPAELMLEEDYNLKNLL